MLPSSRKLNMRTAPEGKIIKPEFSTAFEYSDCWVDDARLVVLNALDAKTRGATILTRTAATSARRDNGLWTVDMTARDGTKSTVRAKALVNSAGPWVEDVIGRVAGRNSKYKVRLVKGSHIVTPKFWDGPQAYLLQNDDKRVIFVNPYEGDKTLIGTTDIPYTGKPEDVAIEQKEIDYLLRVINRYVVKPLTEKDVLYSFSGVRPLYDDDSEKNPSAVTRDYVFEVDDSNGQPPLLSVFGGKITTFRKLAEHALDKIVGTFPAVRSGLDRDRDPAGRRHPQRRLRGLPRHGPPRLSPGCRRSSPSTTPISTARASASCWPGRRVLRTSAITSAASLYQREADFLRRTEWALTGEDILRRRTKHGLHMSERERSDFDGWMEAA